MSNRRFTISVFGRELFAVELERDPGSGKKPMEAGPPGQVDFGFSQSDREDDIKARRQPGG